MKILQWTLAVVGGIALVLVGVGLLLPSGFEVRRSIEINAPAGKVYDLVSDPRIWTKWSAWNKRDPKMDITYAGPPFGQGARWSWKSESQGNGSMEFTRVEPNRRIEYALHFADMNMRSGGVFLFEPAGAGTRVTWTNAGDLGANPLRRYLGLMMERFVGPDFEEGLANLKRLAESA